MVAHRRPIIEKDHEIEARPVEMIGVSLFNEVSGHDADHDFLMVGQCLVMEHEWPVEALLDNLQQFVRGGNRPMPCGMVLDALTIIPLDDLLDCPKLCKRR